MVRISVGPGASEISIAHGMKGVIIGRVEDETFVLRSNEIATNVFDSYAMSRAWISAPTRALMDSKGNVGSSVGSKKVEFANDRAIIPGIRERG